MKKSDRRPISVDATEPLTLEITQKSIDTATPKCAGSCVIAQAVKEHFGKKLEDIEVGATTTKIKVGGIIYRYTTPSRLRTSLLCFDITKKWDLPPGQITLLIRKPSKKRWSEVRHSGGIRSVFNGRAIPTRIVRSIHEMKKAA